MDPGKDPIPCEAVPGHGIGFPPVAEGVPLQGAHDGKEERGMPGPEGPGIPEQIQASEAEGLELGAPAGDHSRRAAKV